MLDLPAENLRLVDVRSGEVKTLFAGSFYAVKVDAVNETVALYAGYDPPNIEQGTYLLSILEPTPRAIEHEHFHHGQIDGFWRDEVRLFVTDFPCEDDPDGFQAFDFRGDWHCVHVPVLFDFYPSPNEQWRVSLDDGVWIEAEALSAAAPASLSGAPSTTTLAQGSALIRIRFASGATSALVSGDLPESSSARYVLRALAGQLMEVKLSAPQGTSLSVTTAAGRALAPITGSSTAFRGYLPRNGDYLIEVASGGQAVSYSVSESVPQRVAFERGATSISLRGHVDAHRSHDYILRARAGQLNVTPAQAVQLIIYGADGTVLKSGMGEGTSFSGDLPATQDYVLVVRAGADTVAYSLRVIIR